MLRLVFTVLIFLFSSTQTQAQTLFVRGRRGPIVPNNGNRLVRAQTVRGAPNLVFMNGGVFERDRNGRLNQLGIELSTGRLVGATGAGTAGQLAGVLGRMFSRFTGKARQAIAAFLRVNRPTAVADAGSPSGAGSRTLPPPGGRVATDRNGGKHGQGSRTDTSPQPKGASARRPTADVDASAGPAGKCGNLADAVCGDPNAQNRDRLADDFKRNTVVSFLKAARLDGRTFGGILGGILQDPRRFGAAYQAFVSFLSGRMGSDVKEALASARSSLLASIESQPFSESVKASLRQKLSTVRFRVTPNFSSFESLRAFVENCGPEGMGDGAFAIPNQGEVVICPGLIFGGKGKGGDLASHVAHVLAHEMGHHVGADRTPSGFGPFKPIYGPMEKCYLTKFSGLGANRMGEVTADTWGVEAMAVQLRGKSTGQAFAFVQNAMAPLCGTQGSPEHPPGAFRINVTVGRNPRIRAALGCADPTLDRLACTMAGQVPSE